MEPNRPAFDRDVGAVIEKPPATTLPAGWLGLPVERVPLPGSGYLMDVHFEHAWVGTAISGTGRRWSRDGLQRRDLYTAPQMVEFVAAGHTFDAFGFDGEPGEVIGVDLPIQTIVRLLQDQPLNFCTRHEHFDEALRSLICMMWAEASEGSPHGPLYVEGLTIALVGLLLNRYSPGPNERKGIGVRARFSAIERSRLREFIASELGGDMRVERLAFEVGMSPFHFSRVFKQAFGLSPHAYVVEQRIAAACTELRGNRDRSVAEIATGCGFSSQAHFIEVFRRRMGTTPGRWRLDRT
jgi:AraC family transcriptional regulator